VFTGQQRMDPIGCMRSYGSSSGKPNKVKMKPLSSLKRRFRLIKGGSPSRSPSSASSWEYKRSRCGNSHLAFGKSHTRKRRLRQTTNTHKGYAKVMKKMGFKLS